MSEFIPAIRDESRSETGNVVGDTAKDVFYNGKPVALAGSVTSSGATIVDPPKDRNIYIEGRLVATAGDALSDGSILLPIKKDSN